MEKNPKNINNNKNNKIYTMKYDRKNLKKYSKEK